MSTKPSRTGNANSNGNRDRDETVITAATWIARRERGFTPAERVNFDKWLIADQRHATAVAEIEATWGRLDGLSVLRPAEGLPVNPDFFRGRRQSSRKPRLLPIMLAAAAVVLLGFMVFWRTGSVRTPDRLVLASAGRHLTLSDGSDVALKGDSLVDVNFTVTERRVVLQRGEANFTVAKNPARPFLVAARGVVVRAVGTVFTVRLQTDGVEVVVTEGKVRVAPDSPLAADEVKARFLVAGERLLVPTPGQALAASEQVSGAEGKTTLAWQGEELVFAGQPLANVVEEFNLRSERKLVIRDVDLGAVRVGGKFRADNVEGFVRLLENGFGISAERKDSEIVLRKAQ